MAVVAFGKTAKAPQDFYLYAEEKIILQGNSISSLSNKGVNPNDPKVILGLKVKKYLINYEEIYQTIICESNFRHEGVFGDSGKAYGIAQFHKPTFDGFCEGDYYNMEDQLECMAKMFSNNLQSHWTCFSRLYGI